MDYTTNEEQSLNLERFRKSSKREDLRKVIMLSLVLGVIAATGYAKGFGDEFTCPCCETTFELIIEPYEAKECPGAGWYCNNCDMFQCHGTKCTYCKWPRYKKK